MTDASPTESALRDLYGAPGALPAKAVAGRLEEHARRFISLSPLVVVASTGADGHIDVSPRGDAPGFVDVRDDTTLVIPDRRGNNKIDTLRNVAGQPKVGLMFVIPGIEEVLRLRGTSRITVDPGELARHAVDGKAPRSALIVTVETVFPHCGKAFRRARLWDEEAKLDRKRDGVPSLAQIALAMAGMDDVSVTETDVRIEQDYRENLY
ncbi:MAG: pyridoxamine 5'-phosphate oxidase family protein [Bauldia litoralis]